MSEIQKDDLPKERTIYKKDTPLTEEERRPLERRLVEIIADDAEYIFQMGANDSA